VGTLYIVESDSFYSVSDILRSLCSTVVSTVGAVAGILGGRMASAEGELVPRGMGYGEG